MVQSVPSALVILPLMLAFGTVVPLLLLTRFMRFSLFRLAVLGTFFLYSLGVIQVTMFPLEIVPESMRSDSLLSSSLNLVPLANADLRSFALNIVMMIPFGFLLPMLAPRFASLRRIAVAGFLTSVAIEGTQLLLLLTLGNRRVIEVDDLIANTGGAALGYLGFLIVYGIALAFVRTVQPAPVRRAEPIPFGNARG